MEEGLKLLTRYAFNTLGLHRLEANIQPDNVRSQKLVERCGFVKEGYSEAFLFINGAWRDHERWCCVHPRTALRSHQSAGDEVYDDTYDQSKNNGWST